jgi:hypothetical protein
MQLRPRHFILLAVVIGLFVFNIVKHRRDNQARNIAPVSSPTTAAAWAAYDHAAGLRDAPDAQFQPAFNDLRTATEGPDSSNAATAQAFAEVIHCKIWLNFYRNPTWQPNARKHVLGCTQFHRDAVV